MKRFGSIDEASASGALQGTWVCLGTFDGVHLGHRALVDAARREGLPTALTFWPHPAQVLNPPAAPRLITTLEERGEALGALGVQALVVQPFTLDWSRTTADAFEAALFDALKVAGVVVGPDHGYGARRQGNVARLVEAAGRRGARVQVVSPVQRDGRAVSSSWIRECLAAGDVRLAAALLGRPFSVRGEVEQGDRRGRQLGFPTANVWTRPELLLAHGVYAVSARVAGEAPFLPGAADLGLRPTFDGTRPRLEVHLLDVSKDLYGATLEVRFHERLRGEQRFASLQALQQQLGVDVARARALLAAELVGG